ncbi:uncharacterized protein [Centruroides vittatus]
MDDGGRCLLDVINDPNLLRSFLESGSDKVQEILTGQRNVWHCQTLNSVPELDLSTQNVHHNALSNTLDQQDGSCSDTSFENSQIRQDQVTNVNHFNSTILVPEPSSEQLGFTCQVDNAGLLSQTSNIGVSTVCSSPVTFTSYHTPSPVGTTIHHVPSPAHPQPSPATPRSATPLPHAVRSPSQGSPSVQSIHSMPPPSPLQQTRSPLPSHTPSPAPAWSPIPIVQSPAMGRTQTVAHNQLLQTSGNVTQVVQTVSQQIAQKLQLQQQVIFQHQSQQPRLPTVAAPSVIPSTTNVPMAAPPVVQIIPAPQQSTSTSTRNPQTSVRPIQPKQPQQILPKPVGTASNQFATPVVKQVGSPGVASNQRTVGMGINTGQVVIGQGQPGVFTGPQGTIVLNQIIPAVGQSPILIQGNLGNLPGVQFTLRPQQSSLTASASSGQTQSGAQNNAALIAALQAQSQTTQTLFTQAKASLPGQQTIVIPSSITHPSLTAQNLNLAATANPSVNNTVVPTASQGQGLLTRPNIILAPRLMGPNQGIQFQQIQTPQGPITVALAPSQSITLPQLPTALQNTALGAHLNAGTIPASGVMTAGQSVISSISLQAQPTAGTISTQQQLIPGTNVTFQNQTEQPSVQIATVSNNTITSTPTTSQTTTSSEISSTSTSKPIKVPSVNLAELLKQHGIVPETTPPSSPTQSPHQDILQSSPSEDTNVINAGDISKGSTLIDTLQSSPQIITVTQPNQTVPQVKLTLAHDGSVILQSHNLSSSNVPQGQAQGLDIQTSTVTVSPFISTATTSAGFMTSTTQNHSALLARLNAAPAVDMTSLNLAGSICTPTTVTSTITTTPTISPLIPLTVQNISDGIVPITSAQFTTQPATTLSTQETIFQDSCMPIVNSNSSLDNVVPSSRINHVIVGVQVATSQNSSLPSVNSGQTSHIIATSSMDTVADNSAPVSTLTSNLQSNGIPTKITHDISQGLPASNIGTIQATVVPSQNIQLNVPNQQIETENRNISQSQLHLQSVATSVVPVQSQPNSSTSQNVRLVNLLKQGPVQSIPLRVIAPAPCSVTSSTNETLSTVTNIAVPTQVRVGNQILTLATRQAHTVQGIQHQFRSFSADQQQFPQTQQVVLRIQQNQQLQQKQQSSVSTLTVPGVIQIQNKLNRIGVPVSKASQFQQQLRCDHNGVLRPNCKQPFTSYEEACRRLLPYHVFNSQNFHEEDLNKVDQSFEAISHKCLERIKRLHNKYHYLLLKEGMKSSPTPESVMLERLFIQEETEALKEDKRLVENGKVLNLPPPPESWKKLLQPAVKCDIIKFENPTKEEIPVTVTQEDTSKTSLKLIEVKGISSKRKFSDNEELNDVTNKHLVKFPKNIKKPVFEENEYNKVKSESFSESECNLFISPNIEMKQEPNKNDNSKEEDIVTTLRRELNMSPLEDDEPDVSQVDFETPNDTGGLADFEPPVARTEESSLVSSYANGSRTAVKMKYDFDIISDTAEWIGDYTNHNRKTLSESEAAVESILEGQEGDSDLDLSGIELDETLERHQVLYNGIEETRDSYVNYNEYDHQKLRTHKEREKFSKIDICSDHSTNELEQSAQVQSAIKSILELQQTENNSCYTDGEENFTSSIYKLERHENHQSPIFFEENLDTDSESVVDAALNEAVRSILL